jgi:hypothetical protein
MTTSTLPAEWQALPMADQPAVRDALCLIHHDYPLHALARPETGQTVHGAKEPGKYTEGLGYFLGEMGRWWDKHAAFASTELPTLGKSTLASVRSRLDYQEASTALQREKGRLTTGLSHLLGVQSANMISEPDGHVSVGSTTDSLGRMHMATHLFSAIGQAKGLEIDTSIGWSFDPR